MSSEKLKIRVVRKFVQMEGRTVTAVLHAIRLDSKESGERSQSIVVQYHRAAFESNSDVLTDTAERLLLLEEGCEVPVSLWYEARSQIGPTRHLYKLSEIHAVPSVEHQDDSSTRTRWNWKES